MGYLNWPSCRVIRTRNSSYRGKLWAREANISLQLVAQHCCFASYKALLPALPPPRNKFQCCKLQQHIARSRTRLYFWQQILMFVVRFSNCAATCNATRSEKTSLIGLSTQAHESVLSACPAGSWPRRPKPEEAS